MTWVKRGTRQPRFPIELWQSEPRAPATTGIILLDHRMQDEQDKQ